MAKQCVLAPVVIIGEFDEVKKQSPMYEQIQEKIRTLKQEDLKPFVDKLIDNGVFGNVKALEKRFEKTTSVRLLTQFLFMIGETRGMDNAAGNPIQYDVETVLSMFHSVIEDKSFAEELIELLGYDKDEIIYETFNPIIPVSSDFTKSDLNDLSKILVSLYFDYINGKNIPDNIESYNGNMRLILNAMYQSKTKNILKTDKTIIQNYYKEEYHQRIINDLNKPSSKIYKAFSKYIKDTYSITLDDVKPTQKILDTVEDDEIEQIDANDGLTTRGYEVPKEQIDYKQTLSSLVKTQLYLTTYDKSFRKRNNGKTYLSVPTDINYLWNKLIQQHINDVTFDDFYNTIKSLYEYNSLFKEIFIKFDNVKIWRDAGKPLDYAIKSIEEDNNFVNAYIGGLGLSVIPVHILKLDSNFTANVYQRNREAFAWKVYLDKFESAIYSKFNPKKYSTEKLNNFKTLINNYQKVLETTTREDYIKDQIQVCEFLGLNISKQAFDRYYDNNPNNYSYIDKRLIGVLEGVSGLLFNSQTSHSSNGYLTTLAKLASYEFLSHSNLSYLDVQGKLNYSAQYDSYLTKFFRNFKTKDGVNEKGIKKVLSPYIANPYMKNDPILWYNPETNIGIFEKDLENDDYQIAKSFIEDVESEKQFTLSSFNGIDINNKALKYKQIGGKLTTFVKTLLRLKGYYAPLTSDSPRSYLISTKSIPINGDIKFYKDTRPKPKYITSLTGEINKDFVKSNKDSLFIYLGDKEGVKDEIRHLPNTLKIYNYKTSNGWKRFTEDDVTSYIEDFNNRVKPKVKDAINKGKHIYLKIGNLNGLNSTPELYQIVDDFITSLKEEYRQELITSQEINPDHPIFKTLYDIVDTDWHVFQTYGKHIFSYKDDSKELKTKHSIRYYGKDKKSGKYVKFDENGIPLGRAFQFLNIQYKQNDTYINLPKFISSEKNVSEKDVYQAMVKHALGEQLTAKELEVIPNTFLINKFITNYISWCANDVINEFESISELLYNVLDNTSNTGSQVILDEFIKDSIDQVYKNKLNNYKAQNQIDSDEDVSILIKDNLKKQAKDHIIKESNLMDLDGIRLFLLQVILNHTIHDVSMSKLFTGDITEYKDTVEYNKRSNQMIRNGYNPVIDENDTLRRVLVVEDLYFDSNILSKMEGVIEPFIYEAYANKTNTSDSMSIMTDVALISYLKATGRWTPQNALVAYINDLRDPNTPFNPIAYQKIQEQMKVFCTARRRRGDFYKGNNDDIVFDDEIDSVQIKDSTIILFPAMVEGTALGDLYDKMIERKIDQISPISAVKVGGVLPIKLHNDNAGLDVSVFDNLDESHYLYLQNSDFVIQQDIKADILDKTVILGSQLTKQVIEGLADNESIYKLDGKPLTGTEIKQEFQSVISTNIIEDALNIYYEMGILNQDGSFNIDSNGNPSVSISKILKVLKRVVDDEVEFATISASLELDENGDSKMPLSYPVVRDKLTKIVASIVTKKCLNQHLPGFHAPIRADVWTSANELITHKKLYSDPEKYNQVIDDLQSKGAITYKTSFIEKCKKEKRSLELRADYIEDGNYYYAEVLLSSPWMEDFYNTIGKRKEINGKITYTIDIDKLSDDACRMIGIRIPTEGKQSMVVFEVVGIINSGATQAIFPQSLVTRTGWDFDIDSIYAYYKSLKFNFNDSTYDSIKWNSPEALNHTEYESLVDIELYNPNSSLEKENYTSKSYLNTILTFTRNFDTASLTDKEFIKSLQLNDVVIIKKINELSGVKHSLTSGLIEVATILKSPNSIANSDKLINTLKNLNHSINDLQKTITFLKNTFNLLDQNVDTDIQENRKVFLAELIEIETNLQTVINKQNNIKSEFIKDNAIVKQLSKFGEYGLNNRAARNNRIIDIITSILSNPQHRNDVDKPNEMDHIKKVSQDINGIWGKDLKNLNPHNIFDNDTLDSTSMASTILKGHSVNFDTLLAVLSTCNTRLTKPIVHAIHIDDLPTPKGWNRKDMFTYNAKGDIDELSDAYYNFIDNLAGINKTEKDGSLIHNISFNKDRKVVIINDFCINNDISNTHTDISGGKLGYQMSEWTSAILDVLKEGLGFIINEDTLSVARAMSMGITIELYGDKNGKTINRFARTMALLHQPAIVELIDLKQINITDSYYTLDKALSDIKTKYASLILKYYFEAVNNNELKPISLHSKIKSFKTTNDPKVINEIASSVYNKDHSQLSSITKHTDRQCTKELINNIQNRYKDNHKLGWLLKQYNALCEFEYNNEIAKGLVNLSFKFKTENKVDSVQKADRLMVDLAEYYYPTKFIQTQLNNRFNKTLEKVNELKETDDQIEVDFYTLTTQNFKKKHDLRTNKNKPLAVITFPDIQSFKEQWRFQNTPSARKTFLEKLSIRIPQTSLVVTNSTIPSESGKDIVAAIFPNVIKSDNIDINNDTFLKEKTKSIYPIIETRFIYGHQLVSNCLRDIVLTRNKQLVDGVISRLYETKSYIDDATYKKILDGITTYLMSTSDINDILTPDDTPQVLSLLGVPNTQPENIGDIIFHLQHTKVNKLNKDINNFINFTKLSVAQQIEVIKVNPDLKYLISDNNIFNFISSNIQYRNKKYDRLTIRLDENDPTLTNDIIESIKIMWNSTNPYIAHAIRSLIIYSYVTEGLVYGYNISKYIPIDIISEKSNNKYYNHYIDKANARMGDKPSALSGVEKITPIRDLTKRLYLYKDVLRDVEDKVRNGIFNVNDIVAYLQRSYLQFTLKIPTPQQQKTIYKESPHSATIGYLLNKNDKNVATFSYVDEKDNNHDVFLETEARLLNSKFYNLEYVSSYDQILYKRIQINRTIKNSPLTRVYAYIPVNQTLQNELSLMTGDLSIIPDPKLGEKAIINDNNTEKAVTIEEYIELNYHHVIEPFLKAIDPNFKLSFVDEIPNADIYPVEGVSENTNAVKNQETLDATVIESDAVFAIDLKNLYDYPVETKHGSLTDNISQIVKSTDNQIYISSNTVTPNFYKNLHKDIVSVDISKSPVKEALRINSILKTGSLYLNGDEFKNIPYSTEYVYRWVNAFINNIEYLNKGIKSIYTIVNDGIGSVVAHTSTSAIKHNINIYEDEEELFAKIIHTELEDDKYKTTLDHNYSIADESFKRIRKVEKMLKYNGIGDSSTVFKILKDYYKTRNEDEVIGVVSSDEDILTQSLTTLNELNDAIFSIIQNEFEIIKSSNYAENRDDYAFNLDYKNRINNLFKLCSQFNLYIDLKEIQIEDTEFDTSKDLPDEDGNKTEETLEKEKQFKEKYGNLNNQIIKLRSVSKKVLSINGELINKMKDVLTWQIIDRSRNPRLTTAWTKMREYYVNHNYSLEGFDVTTVSFTKDEWLDVQAILFNFDKDITRSQRLLDSPNVTGIPILDNLKVQYDQHKLKSINFRNKQNDKLRELLKELDPELLTSAQKRIKLTEKLLTDEGDWISTYDKKGLHRSIIDLKRDIQDIINTTLYDEYGNKNEESARETLEKTDALIDKYNKENTWRLTRITDPIEINRIKNVYSHLTEREKLIYLQSEDLVIIRSVTDVGGSIDNVIYKLDFTHTPKSKQFEALSVEEQKYLTGLKKLITETIQYYDSNWQYYYGDQEDIVPYIPNADVPHALKSWFSMPMVHEDSTFIDIDGTKRFKLESKTLKLPKYYYKFHIPIRAIHDTNESYETRVMEEFNKWYEKNNKFKDYTKPTSLKEIYKYNDYVTIENKKHKRQTMALDIIDIIEACTDELSTLRCISHWRIDRQITEHLWDYSDGSHPSARNTLINATAAFDLQERNIIGVSKYHDTIDVISGVLMRYTSITYMYLNVTAGIVNLLKGITDMMVDSVAGSFLESKTLIKNGILTATQKGLKYLSQLNDSRTDDLNVAIIKSFDDIYQDTTDVKASNSASSMWTKLISNLNKLGYSPNNITEFIMQYGVLLAATHSHRVLKGKNIATIVSFNEFYNDGLEKLLNKVLTTDQWQKYLIFKEEYDKNIKQTEKKTGKRFVWDNDYAAQFLKQALPLLSKEQQQDIINSRKQDKKLQKEAFDKLPTLNSQFELVDGRLSVKKESLLTENDLAQFKARVKAINQSLQGIYDKIDQNSLEADAITAPLMQFKKWIKSTWNRYFGRRFGQIFYNEQLSSYEVPIYLPVFDLWDAQKIAFKNTLGEKYNAWDVIKGIGNYLKEGLIWLKNISFIYNTLPLNEQIAYRKFARHLGSLAFAAICVLTAGAFRDDDDEDSTTYNYIMYTATSYYQQMIEPVPVIGWISQIEQMTNSLFAGQKVIVGAGKLVTLATQAILTDKDMIYDRGIYKGENKITVAASKLIPIWRQWNKHEHLQATMSYYNMYNPFAFSFEGVRSVIGRKDANESFDDNE